MAQPQLQDLLEAGVHFGHQTRRWNPKMRRFIFAERSGIYIIDLQKTLQQLQQAQELLRSVVLKGEGDPLRLHQEAAQGHSPGGSASGAASFYVTERWLGGHAHQLPDHQEADQAPEGPGAGRGRRRLRELHQEGAAPLRARAGEAGQEPVGHQEHGAAAGRAVRRGRQEGDASRWPRPTSSAFRWWPSWTPTPIRM